MHLYQQIRTLRASTAEFRRVGQKRAAAGCYAPLRTTSRRFHHLSARFDDTTSADLADYRRYRRVGQQRAATDHSSRFPHLSARLADATSANLADRCGNQLPCRRI